MDKDLAYVTDRIIVMGFPAVGVESIYRNHRADVQRFLSARHGSDFWVFNFCPLRENAYHESVFGGRVSRYPFPDHQSVSLVFVQAPRLLHAAFRHSSISHWPREKYMLGSLVRTHGWQCFTVKVHVSLSFFRSSRDAVWKSSWKRKVRYPRVRVFALALRFTFRPDAQLSPGQLQRLVADRQHPGGSADTVGGFIHSLVRHNGPFTRPPCFCPFYRRSVPSFVRTSSKHPRKGSSSPCV